MHAAAAATSTHAAVWHLMRPAAAYKLVISAERAAVAVSPKWRARCLPAAIAGVPWRRR